MSARARHLCYFCDYGALSLYSLGEPPPRDRHGAGDGDKAGNDGRMDMGIRRESQVWGWGQGWG
uniref:Uncharacterized protein n=1 Tax=Calidris pygmaea TaxID=425635 RepID=A0A8C3KFY3_9CHAR